MRSVELNNIGLIQKQPKISMLNTRLSCFELTSSPDQSVVINRTYSGFHSFQIYRWREKNALLTSEVSFAAVFWHFTQHSLGERSVACQKTAEKEASYSQSFSTSFLNSFCHNPLQHKVKRPLTLLLTETHSMTIGHCKGDDLWNGVAADDISHF